MEYKPVHLSLSLELSVECQSNPWICAGGSAFNGDLELDFSSPFRFIRADAIDELKALLRERCWPIRLGIVFNQLAMVKQSLADDEWFVLKHFPTGWLGFSVINLASLLAEDEGRFDRLLASMQKADAQACRSHTFDPEMVLAVLAAELDRPIVETARVHVECEKNPKLRDHFIQSLIRFLKRDWGDSPQEDKISNDENQSYQLASYSFPAELDVEGERNLWIINDGSCITVLFPSDY